MDVLFYKVRNTPQRCDNCDERTERPVFHIGTSLYGQWVRQESMCHNCETQVVARLEQTVANYKIRFTGFSGATVPECLKQLEEKYDANRKQANTGPT
jgi:hypothetical protein